MSISIDREYLTNTLIDLVKINSVNPSISPTGAGEAEIASYVARALGDMGLEASVRAHEANRASAVGILRGSGGGRSLMLNAHCDTVGVEGMPEPFSAGVREGRLYGRGAYDMKGSLAAQMAAAKSLVDAGVMLAGDLVLAAAADEECRSMGTAGLIKEFPVDAAIVTEPTEFEICVAHKGFAWLEVKTTGLAAHGSRVEEGVDANMMMGRFLHGLEKLERDLRRREGHPLAGPPSLHAPVIAGGTEPSTYAAACVLTVERRTVPGETGESVLAELQAIIDDLSAADPSFVATAKATLVRDPFEVPVTAPVVNALAGATYEVLGRDPVFGGRAWWTDAGLLSAAGVESVVAGPVGGGPHSLEEWVDLGSLVDFARILAYTAIEYCNSSGSVGPAGGSEE
jgi:acetylornithine deacetylase